MIERNHLLYLPRSTLEALSIAPSQVADAIEKALHGQEAGRVWCAPKAALQPPDGRYLMATLSAADDPPYQVVKSLVLNDENSKQGLPQINSLISLLDSKTGLPVAVMDGNWVTELRTAGLSAVAARRLARTDCSSVAFIGCGTQARSHLTAFKEMFPLTTIKAFGRGRANVDRLCALANQMGLEASAPDTPRATVEGADLVVSSVSLSITMEPFLRADWLKPGVFATITDIGGPWEKDSYRAFDSIILDDMAQEAAMEHKLAAPELVSGDLADLVLGRVTGRTREKARTAFIFRAHPLGDFALAAMACDLARGQGVEARLR